MLAQRLYGAPQLSVGERRLDLRRRALGAQPVEQPVQVPSPRLRRDLNRSVEDRRERPEEQREVRKDEVGAERALRAGALEHLFEEPAELLACGCQLAGTGEIAHERV